MLIYKGTNKTNGQGIHRADDQDRWKTRISAHMREARTGKRSKSAFHSALLKYGLDSFEIEVVETCDTVDQLNERERYWITTLNTISPSDTLRKAASASHERANKKQVARAKAVNSDSPTPQPHQQQPLARVEEEDYPESNKGKTLNEKQRRALADGRNRPNTLAEIQWLKGETNPRAILTDDEVREIRRLYSSNTSEDRWAQKEYTQDRLARMFNVKQITISTIVTRKTWTHID